MKTATKPDADRTEPNVASHGRSPRLPTGQQIAAGVAVLVPFLGLVAAVYSLWGWGITWVELTLLLAMYAATGFGITVGYHRLFAHKSFVAAGPLRFALSVLGAMAVQGPAIKWVAVHRRHHQHSDQPDDPHSPHNNGAGVRGVIAGFWHAHIGWMFRADHHDLTRYVRDLYSDRIVRMTSRYFGVWVALGLLIPAILGGVLTGTWTGVLLGFLWGGLVRVFLGHHVTWSINSVCHLWGTRPYDGGDLSRNNVVFGVLGLGEGWHNNHHAFPSSARYGLRWWQFDPGYVAIRILAWTGLASGVRVPARERIFANRVTAR